jgi:hypothetical protein
MRTLDLPGLCQQICDPACPTTLIAMPGKLFGWEFQLRPDETRVQMEDQKRVWELLRPWITCDDARILRAIDAYADMTMTGNPPPDDLIEYGYGGSQQLPGLSTGLLADGASEWIGRLIPQLKVRNGAERGRFDDVVGPHWAVLSRCHREAATSEQQRRSWKHLDAAFVEVADPADAWFLGEGEVVIVRPDRIVFSLGRDSTLPEPFVALLPSRKNS